MTEVKKIWLLWIVAILGVATFLFWKFLHENLNPILSENYGLTVSFYHAPISIVFFLLYLFIFVNFKKYFITFLLLGFGINNVMDELFFDPTKLQLNELVFTIVIISFGLFRQRLIRRDAKGIGKNISHDDIRYNNSSITANNRE